MVVIILISSIISKMSLVTHDYSQRSAHISWLCSMKTSTEIEIIHLEDGTAKLHLLKAQPLCKNIQHNIYMDSFDIFYSNHFMPSANIFRKLAKNVFQFLIKIFPGQSTMKLNYEYLFLPCWFAVISSKGRCNLD